VLRRIERFLATAADEAARIEMAGTVAVLWFAEQTLNHVLTLHL